MLPLALSVLFALTPGDESWVETFNFKGDIRVRGESTDYDLADKKNRNRGRFRLRVGIERELNQSLSVGLRLASSLGDPTSTNHTFDNGFGDKELRIDLAFVKYQQGDFQLEAGKLKNPFLTTKLLWDGDVNPEGLAQKISFDKVFLNFGEFVVEESSSGTDVLLFAVQSGFKLNQRDTIAAAYYYYKDANHPDLITGGNTAWVNDFRLLDVVYTLKKVGNWSGSIQLVKNLAEDAPEEEESQDFGYELSVKFTSPQKDHPWSLQYKYSRIEANSVFGYFADSDFGYADKKGHTLKLNFSQNKYLSWTTSLYATESIYEVDQGFNRLQIDCIVKF